VAVATVHRQKSRTVVDLGGGDVHLGGLGAIQIKNNVDNQVHEPRKTWVAAARTYRPRSVYRQKPNKHYASRCRPGRKSKQNNAQSLRIQI
jgi:hypothetical protein